MSGDYRPYTLVAELTYRCPLRCPYCSNPLEWARQRNELAHVDIEGGLKAAAARGESRL